MNYFAECIVTISKKLEKILENGEPISIYINPVNKNKAKAQIRFTAKSGVPEEDIKFIGDTSLLFTFYEVSQDVPDLESGASPVQNIFSTAVDNKEIDALTIAPEENSVQKITSGTEQRVSEEKMRALSKDMAKKTVEASAVQEEGRYPAVKIRQGGQVGRIELRDYESFARILSYLPDMDQDLPEINEEQRMDRKAALAYERKLRQLPKLPFSVYLRNVKGGQIEIQDIDIILKHEEVMDLSSVPAKKLLLSRDLRICLERDFVSFVTRGEYDRWQEKYKTMIGNMSGESRSVVGKGLEVYGSLDEAADKMFVAGESPNIDEAGPSKFIDGSKAKKRAPIPQIRNLEEVPASDMVDFTEEVVGPEIEYEEGPEKWVPEDLKDLVSTLPEDSPDRKAIQKTLHPPSVSHNPIRRAD